MINIWLKIRTRHGHNQDANFVLRHLSFWLDTFSNRSKYLQNIIVIWKELKHSISRTY
jgi:hypothetical protein